MKNGRLNADLSTKMGTKTADNPDNCVSNPLYTLNCGKMRGGGVMRNIRKLETKLPKPDAEKITKKVTKTAKNPDNYP